MIVDVAVPYRVFKRFDYSVDDPLAQDLVPGSVVEVQFRKRPTHAFVLGVKKESQVSKDRLLSIDKVLVTAPVFDSSMLKLISWMSEYYCHPLGEILSATIPSQYFRISPEKWEKYMTENSDHLFQGIGLSDGKPKILNNDQELALKHILESFERPILLNGVTGSGKTEVYLSVLEKTLGEGKGAIILVPEIALTPQLLSRFIGRFPGKVAVLHSQLTVKERLIQFEKIRRSISRIVIGARSAVFAPVRNLGLIVVDEEHETSYKQDEKFCYQARDVAVMRAKISGARIILGSATPSVESYANAERGKYVHVELPNRVNRRELPQTRLVDLKEKSNLYHDDCRWLSRYLVAKISETLARKEQILLFLNRLGYAHFLFCSDCGHTWRCHQCDVALTFYQSAHQLKCHYCAFTQKAPTTCEICQGSHVETIGVGTEQVETKIKELFPSARVVRMDRSIVKTRHDLERVLNGISEKEYDIVIGTQMMAKGHDFPGISLVGILMADASLNLPDFRAHERTFQLITQVAGRAGRAEIAGEVVIQTVQIDHPIILLAAQGKSKEFYRQELAGRMRFHFPPFARLAMLRFQHPNHNTVCRYSHEIAAFVRKHPFSVQQKCAVLGPAEAPLAKLKNQYRWQCLVRAQRTSDLSVLLADIQTFVATKKNAVKVTMDVDPIHTL